MDRNQSRNRNRKWNSQTNFLNPESEPKQHGTLPQHWKSPLIRQNNSRTLTINSLNTTGRIKGNVGVVLRNGATINFLILLFGLIHVDELVGTCYT
jgi:hypothetical protein